MKAGLLKERITVLESKNNTSEFGESKTSWFSKYSTRAFVKTTSQDRSTENNEIFFSTTVEFKIRFYHEINEWNRIQWNGKQYRILSIMPNKDAQEINIITELINE